MDIFGDRGEHAWFTRPISDRRFDDEDKISPELADFVNSPKFAKGFRDYQNGEPVEPETIDTDITALEV